MASDVELSELIGGIYDASLDPGQWPEVLQRSARYVGGTAAGLSSHDGSRREGLVHYDGGPIEDKYRKLYFNTYMKLNPVITGKLMSPVYHPVRSSELMPIEDFMETRFCKEWVMPQGWVDNLATTLERTAMVATIWNIFFHYTDPPPTEQSRHRMALLAPHVHRAFSIARTLDYQAAEISALHEAFDGLATAFFLVGVEGRLVHANASAVRLLEQRRLFHAVRGRLTTVSTSHGTALSEAIANSASGIIPTDASSLALPLVDTEGAHHVAHVLPMTFGARRREAARHAAVAAIFVRQEDVVGPSPVVAIAELYKLTPAELRVLFSIVELGGVPETAAALGIAESTVKTHLNRLFAKTDCKRQVDLVKLVARFASPIAEQK